MSSFSSEKVLTGSKEYYSGWALNNMLSINTNDLRQYYVSLSIGTSIENWNSHKSSDSFDCV